MSSVSADIELWGSISGTVVRSVTDNVPMSPTVGYGTFSDPLVMRGITSPEFIPEQLVGVSVSGWHYDGCG